jgi:hypothetical protein
VDAAKFTGRCLCGAVAFRITGQPRDVHHCHCSMCRRATGAAFATLVWVIRRDVDWQGQPARYRASTIATRGFCSRCGTALFLDYDGNEQVALLLGAFDRPERLVPTHHYGIESKLPWVDLQKNLPGKPTDVHPQP